MNLNEIKKRVVGGYVVVYRCKGGCEDTGWVEIDDGLDAEGKRVGAPTVRRCRQCEGPQQRVPGSRGGSFT